jgi:hypothetical protein
MAEDTPTNSRTHSTTRLRFLDMMMQGGERLVDELVPEDLIPARDRG